MTVAGRVATNPVGTELTRPRAAHAPPLSDHLARRVVIDNVRPRVDEGRFPIKRTVGESVEVIADIFANGHDMLVAVICDRHEQGFGIGDSGFESSRIPNPESQIP